MRPSILPLVVCVLLAAGSARAATPKAAGTKGKHRLNIYSVKATGALTSWQARDRLRSYREAALTSCVIPSPEGSRKDIRGEVSVRAKLKKDGTLGILEIRATREHQSLVSCLKGELKKWQLSTKASDAGSEVSFKLYISFPSGASDASNKAKSAGILGALRKPTKQEMKSLFGKSSVIGGLKGGSLGLAGAHGTVGTYTDFKSNATIKVLRVSGTIAKSMLQWSFKQMSLEFEARYCHRKAAMKDPKIAGKLKLKLQVDALGAVDRLEVVRASFKDARLQQCLLRNMMRKTYPPSKGRTTVDLEFDLPKAEKR